MYVCVYGVGQQICTFCGNPVRLGDEVSPEFGSAENGESGSQASQHHHSNNKALDAALSFKNRLVDFDRNSAKRTTVLDDQADYVREREINVAGVHHTIVYVCMHVCTPI